MRELVVVSGKGGTGKTSVVASFAALARNAVFADCDVDAADLHLVLAPEVKHSGEFRGGRVARIRAAECTGCGRCAELCRFHAVHRDKTGTDGHAYAVDDVGCEGCGVCVHFCPVAAIDFPEKVSGTWFISETRFGPMVHARLGIAEENSGKLVSKIRKEARLIAERDGRTLIIADGSPGIGCPVIASIAGADMALLVTEPTVSGIHDMRRVAELCARLDVTAAVAVNKSDVNPEMTEKIEQFARERGLGFMGRVPYDDGVTNAQIAGRSVVEFSDGPASQALRGLWRDTAKALEKTRDG
jgi:MinD superfamily P-loop ATPase